MYETEVPQLELTSKVNIIGVNGKGTIELDWSKYDIQNKYFVIYRKQEGEKEWKTIVSLEQKLTGGKYTDILANDQAKPSTATINIKGNSEENNIQIISTSTDKGTKYTYYIEAYDLENTLLASSK